MARVFLVHTLLTPHRLFSLIFAGGSDNIATDL